MKSFKDYSRSEGRESADEAQAFAGEGSTAAELTKKIAAAYNGKSGAEMNSGEKAPGMNHDVPMMYGHQGLQLVSLGGYGNYTSNPGYVYRGYPCVLEGTSER